MLSAFVLSAVLGVDPWVKQMQAIQRLHDRCWDLSIQEGIAKEQAGGVQRHIANAPYTPPTRRWESAPIVDQLRDQNYELRKLNRTLQYSQPLYYDPRSYYVPRYGYGW